MKKFLKFLIPVVVIAIVVAVFCLLPSAEEPAKVIYVSAAGTGDGLTPETPLGHTEGYDAEAQIEAKTNEPKGIQDTHKKNAIWKAFDLLKEQGGTVVLVGVTDISCSDRREESSAAESNFPANKANITVTSVYGGVDYRTKGAKLVLNKTYWSNTHICLKGPTTWENLNIEATNKATPNPGSWPAEFCFFCGGQTTVFGNGLNVTLGTNGLYPSIYGGHRYSNVTKSNVTVKSGTWNKVSATGFGMNSSNGGSVTGDATLTIKGGDINLVIGCGCDFAGRGFASVGGKLTMNLTAGKIEKVFVMGNASANGTIGSSEINVGMSADINEKIHEISPKYTGTYTGADTKVNYTTGGKFDPTTKLDGTFAVQEPKTHDACVFDEDGLCECGKSNVRYVSATGTGDGLTPVTPMGHGVDYTPANLATQATAKPDIDLHMQNAIYRAFDELKAIGGTVVLVGPTDISCANRRYDDCGESEFPKNTANITVTSKFGGFDYSKSNGAKLVLNKSYWINTAIALNGPTTWENLNIETIGKASYSTSTLGTWAPEFVFYCWGNTTVFGEGLNITCGENGLIPSIYAGHRYRAVTGNPSVTIKSGKWNVVSGSGYSINGTNSGIITGDSTITIEGGEIATVLGCGSNAGVAGKGRNFSAVTGKLTINVKDGKIGQLFVMGNTGADSNIGSAELNITKIDLTGKITEIVSGYTGTYAAKTCVLSYHEDAIDPEKDLVADQFTLGQVDKHDYSDGKCKVCGVADPSVTTEATTTATTPESTAAATTAAGTTAAATTATTPESTASATTAAGTTAAGTTAATPESTKATPESTKAPETTKAESEKDSPKTGSYVYMFAIMAVAAVAVSYTVIRFKKVED